MTTIREQLNKWREEDVDAETHITDSEMDILEGIVRKMTLSVATDYLKIISEMSLERRHK